MDVNKELKFLGKFTKKIWGGGVQGGGGSGWGVRGVGFFVKILKKKKNWGGGRGGVGLGGSVGEVRVDVNEELKFL